MYRPIPVFTRLSIAVLAAVCLAALTGLPALAGSLPGLMDSAKTPARPLTSAQRISVASRALKTTTPPNLGPVTSLSMHQTQAGGYTLDLMQPSWVSGVQTGAAGLAHQQGSKIWITVSHPDPAKAYLIDCRFSDDFTADWVLQAVTVTPPKALTSGSVATEGQHLYTVVSGGNGDKALRMEMGLDASSNGIVALYGCDVTPAG